MLYIRRSCALNQMLCACHNLSSFSSFQDYIARFGHGSAKLARQAQSKEKVLAKMVAGGLTEKVSSDKVCSYGNAMKCPNLFPTILPLFPFLTIPLSLLMYCILVITLYIIMVNPHLN